MAATTQDFLIGPVRVMTVREERLFCVSTQAPFDKLDEELARVIPLLDAAKAEAGLAPLHLMVFRYFPMDEAAAQPATDRIWQMDVGVQVTGLDWVRAAGDARIVTLPEMRCAAVLLWAGTAHIGEAYAALKEGIAAVGLRNVGEVREWTLHFQGDESDDTVMLIQMEVAEDA